MCDNKTMENAETTYGFYLIKVPSKKWEKGYYYAVRYKDENGEWLPTKKSTATDNEVMAKAFAIENKEKIIEEYKEHIKNIHKKQDGKGFYKMLEEYYTADSKYLKDDYANNKRFIPLKRGRELVSIIKYYFIPYFKEEKINTIQGITRSVYSGLKIYLQNAESKKGGKLTTKCINTYLTSFNRILQYHERNELIPKLPYSKGTGIIKITAKERLNAKQPNPLPTNMLMGIFDVSLAGKNKRENTLLYYMLGLMGLTTGMREKELGNIRFTDIKYVEKDNYFYVKAYNHKTEYFNRTEEEDYRKIPLHPFVVKDLEYYVKEKGIGATDYLFGSPKVNPDTKAVEGVIHQSIIKKSIIYLYKIIKIKEIFTEENIENALKKIEQLTDIK
jgi:hypothetical protein